MEVRTPLLNAQRTKQRLTTTEQVSIYKYLKNSCHITRVVIGQWQFLFFGKDRMHTWRTSPNFHYKKFSLLCV